MSDKEKITTLFKINYGLGYQPNKGCNSLRSQQNIAPKIAIIAAETAEELKSRLAREAVPLSREEINKKMMREDPGSFNSDLVGPKWAGIL